MNNRTSPLPDRLLTPGLLLREVDSADAEVLAPALAELPPTFRDGSPDARTIVVRSSGRIAGRLGRGKDGETRIALLPEHRRRGRGTEALAAWIEGLSVAGAALRVPDAEHPAARAFYRDFGLRREADGSWATTPRTGERLRDLRAAQLRRYRQRVHMSILELGVPDDYGQGFGLPPVAEARFLAAIGRDVFDRPQFLAPAAARAFDGLVRAATADGVTLQVVSAFRGFDDQLRIIQRKREAGQSMSEIVAVSALPGYSEHHGGGAVDLTTPGAPVLEEAFAATEAYTWLTRHAGAHGFRQSYPRDNPHGIAFEPWHWCHAATADAAVAALAGAVATDG